MVYVLPEADETVSSCWTRTRVGFSGRTAAWDDTPGAVLKVEAAGDEVLAEDVPSPVRREKVGDDAAGNGLKVCPQTPAWERVSFVAEDVAGIRKKTGVRSAADLLQESVGNHPQ